MADTPDKIREQLATPTVKVEGPDGSVVAVTPDAARDGFLGGQYKYIPGETYYVKGADGKTVASDAQTAAAQTARNSLFTEFESPAAVAHRRLQDEYGGFGQGLLEAGEAGLDALTLGASAAAGRAIGGDDYANRRQLQELANPGAHTVGEVIGTGVGLFAGSGEAAVAKGGLGRALARGATAPTRAALEAGALAERGVIAGVEAFGLEGSLATRALAGGARGAVETAAFSAGAEATRQAIHDPDYSAEKLLSAAVGGAEVGGLLGAGLPVVGAALRATGGKVLEAAEAIGGKKLAALEGERLEVARRAALESTGADAKALKAAFAGDEAAAARAGDKILSEAESAVGKPLQTITRNEGLAWAEKAGQASRDEVAAIVGRAEARVGTKVAPELRQTFDRLGDDAIKLSKSAATKTEGKAAVRYLQDLAEELDQGGLAALHNARLGLNNYAQGAPKALQGFYRDLGADLDKAVAASLRRAEELGESDIVKAFTDATSRAKEYDAVASLYRNGIDNVSSGPGGIVSGPAGVAGGAVGGAVAGWPGAWLGREAGKALAKGADEAVGRAVAERGAATAAQTLRDLPTTGLMGGATNAIRGLAGKGPVERGAETLAKGTGGSLDYSKRRAVDVAAAAIAPIQGVVDSQARSRREEVRTETRVAEAKALAARYALSKSPVDQPLQQALLSRVTAAVGALTERETPPSPGVVVQVKLPESQSHRDKIEARRDLVAAPEKLLEQAALGRVTSDVLRLAQAVYPKSLKVAQDELTAKLSTTTKEISPAKLASASMVLGRPADPSMQPHVLGAVQASLQKSRQAKQDQQQGPRPGSAAQGKFKLPGASDPTADQSLMSGRFLPFRLEVLRPCPAALLTAPLPSPLSRTPPICPSRAARSGSTRAVPSVSPACSMTTEAFGTSSLRPGLESPCGSSASGRPGPLRSRPPT